MSGVLKMVRIVSVLIVVNNMETLFSLLKVPVKKKVNVRISTPAHALVEELLEWFGESKKKGMFGRYMGILKRRGEPQVRMIFSELKEQKEHSPKLLMWKCSKKAEPKAD